VERGASGDDALALLHRLDRLDVAGTQALPRAAGRTPTPRADRDPSEPPPDSRLAWVGTGIVAGVLIAVLAGAYLIIVTDPFQLDAPHAAIPAMQEDPLPVPAACELRLARARELFARGLLHEALALLETGDPDERHRLDMNELTASIQRRLLDDGTATPVRAPQVPAPPVPTRSLQR
jgi:hypothetical protein